MNFWKLLAPRWLRHSSWATEQSPMGRRHGLRRLLALEALEGRLTPSVSQFLDPNPSPGNQFGASVIPLSSGNVVVTSPFDDFGGADAGAVYLFNGSTGALISTLRGAHANDHIGMDGVFALSNGNFVVRSLSFDNGAANDVGAVTWGSGVFGVSGTVSSANSLIGSSSMDQVGSGGITVLGNGNYVVTSPLWNSDLSLADMDAGAFTFGNGSSGVSGVLSAANSAVGTLLDDGVGSGGVIVLPSNNFLVLSPNWNQTAGAVTWVSGTLGLTGGILDNNSLVGSKSNFVSNYFVGSGGITILSSGDYVVQSPHWLSERGAATWGSGSTGVMGVVSATNSYVGDNNDDSVSSGGVFALTNGNFVVASPEWNSTSTANVGAATFGTAGGAGIVSAANSLVGSNPEDRIGSDGVTALSNGNYVVNSPNWNNGTQQDAGAATWGNGLNGILGAVTAANSLVGSANSDNVGSSGIKSLENGNYVVSSPFWDNGTAVNAGAATWGNGATGIAGTISAANSLIGGSSDNVVASKGITVLPGGNYVVQSPDWDSATAANLGALTFASGSTGIFGTVDAGNSLVGAAANDHAGSGGVFALPGGNFVALSPNWANGNKQAAGAVTWGNGKSGIAGAISIANSLVGGSGDDAVGSSGLTVLTSGHFVISSPNWDNGTKTDAGAVTWGSSDLGVTGLVGATNSLIGSSVSDHVGGGSVKALLNGNFVVASPDWDHGGLVDAGAVTWGNGTKGSAGLVSIANSLLGTSAGDAVGSGGILPLMTGNFAVNSPLWDNGSLIDAGAVTVLLGYQAPGGTVSSNLSLVGTAKNALLQPAVADNINHSVYAPFLAQPVGGAVFGTTQSPVAPSFTSAVVATFVVGTTGSFTVTAAGDPAPSFSLTGALPAGVTFNTATGLLSGNPSKGTGGVYNLTIQAANKVGSPATQNFTLTVNESPSITSINTTTFSVGNAGSFTFTSFGFPTPTFSTESTLPQGLTLSAAGILSGTPATGSGGSYTLLVVAANGIGANGTQTFTLKVNEATTFTSPNTISFATGVANSFNVTTSGFPTASLSLISGSLPDGVSFDAATGLLSGNPPIGTGGTYNLTFQAANGIGSPVTQDFTLNVSQDPAFLSPNSTTFLVGSPGNFTVRAVGFPSVTLSMTSGILPAGVTFDASTGLLSGTPAKLSGGVYDLVFRATTGIGNPATQDFKLVVNEAAAFASPNRTTFTAGTAGSFTVKLAGYPVPALTLVSGTLPSGVTFDASTGLISGTPAANTGGLYPLVLRAANGIGAPITQDFTLAVNQPVVITNVNAASFAVGTAGSFHFTSTGFPNPFWLVTSGTLPAGLTLNGDTGELSGTPEAGTGGVHQLTIRASNGVGFPVTQTFTLTISEVPSFASPDFTAFPAGASSSFTVEVNGYPAVTLALLSGTLPAGVTFDPVTGILSGTPSAAGLGDYALVFQASNGLGSPVNQKFTLTVNDKPVFTSPSNTTFTEGKAGSFQVSAAAFPPATFSTTTILPQGLSFSASGLISGTPAPNTFGIYHLVITASNGLGDGTKQDFTLTINQPPVFTSPNTATFQVGVASGFTMKANGFPNPVFSITSGSLPAGLTFDAFNGTISGNPAPNSGRIYNLKVRASNGANPAATQDLQLIVNQSPKFTSLASATFLANKAGSFQITASGFPAATFTTNSALPSGITLSASGLLSGTPATGSGGTYKFTVLAQNGINPSVTQDFTLTVNEAPAITSDPSAGFLIGVSGNFTVTATGFPRPTYAILSGTLPAGLNFNTATGVISGIAAPNTNGVYNLKFQASNGVSPDATQNFQLFVAQPPGFTSPSSTTFTARKVNTFTVTTIGIPTPVLELIAGKLPDGVTFDPATGVIAGNPPVGTGGAYPLTFRASNGVGNPAIQQFTLNVNQTPAIVSPNRADFILGVSGSFTILATGYPVPTYQVVTGSLPAGLLLDSKSGIISGIPAAGTVGTYALKVQASNGVGTPSQQSLTLFVNQAPKITSVATTTFSVDAPSSFTVTATGFPAPTFSIIAGLLPDGIKLDATTGVISGIPFSGTSGVYPFTIQASNGVGTAATQKFTLNVSGSPTFTSANKATFAVGATGSFTVTAQSFPTSTFSIVAGTLPQGLVFNGVTGVISGTPAANTGAAYDLKIQASNGVGIPAVQAFTLAVNQPTSITSAAKATFVAAAPSSFLFASIGYPLPTWQVVSGVLPSGMTLNAATGLLSGTVASNAGGSYSLQIKAGNGIGPDVFQNFVITVNLSGSVSQILDPHPSPGNLFGKQTITLNTGNILVTSPLDDFGGTDAGAVYLFDGATGALISSVWGTHENDKVGFDGVTVLPSGKFIIKSTNWANGKSERAGAITFGDATFGVNGPVNAANSLVGTRTGDMVGSGGITVLGNGDYVVRSPLWDNGKNGDAGAVTWASGKLGIVGAVTPSNSLVGSTANDNVGSGGILQLENTVNFLISSPNWDNVDASNAGAVTWVKGGVGIAGAVSSTNSLVGSTAADLVGYGGITALKNGNYVVLSPMWNKVRGAATWGSGATGVSGVLSAANSLVGGTDYSNVGSGGIQELNSGNYLINSYNWDNNKGAVTVADGNLPIAGVVASTNSLVGTQNQSYVGYNNGAGAVEVGNDKIAVVSPLWANGSAAKAGAVTQANSLTGTTGAVSSSNSIVGTQANDRVGSGGVTKASDGNYAVSSPNWANGTEKSAGAITIVKAATGTTGALSVANSLTGSKANDQIGSGGVETTGDGNVVVLSPNWSNGSATGAGAATWINGKLGISGPVSAANSLVGTKAGDSVGSGDFTMLGNGAYLISSPNWANGSASKAGAMTLGNSQNAMVGPITAANSLVGSQAGDRVGSGGAVLLSNGNFVISSPFWKKDDQASAGAITWGTPTAPLSGAVSAANSLTGTSAGDTLGSGGIVALPNGGYVVVSPNWDNGAAQNAGAVTVRSGAKAATGAINAANSLIGTQANDSVGSGGIVLLEASRFLVQSPSWDNGTAANAGAVTWIDGDKGLVGAINAANSLIGSQAGDTVGSGGIDLLSNGNFLVSSPFWDNAKWTNAGAMTMGQGQSGLSGTIDSANSLVGAKPDDMIGVGDLFELPDGKILVRSANWANGGAKGAGAVTMGSSVTGIRGLVTEATSLVGSHENDQVGSGGVTFFTNGNYLISSPNWSNGSGANAGAVTWVKGDTGIVGAVGTGNSQVGAAANSGLQPIVVNDLNESYLSSFLTSPGGGVVNLGYQAPTACAITSVNTATFQEGVAGQFTFTGTGSPHPFFTLLDGVLPTGLSLISSTGLLSGTPLSGSKGTYVLKVQAANGVGSAQTQTFTLVVQ